ncbi:hypothetical protein GVN16_21830 [Emticicia sp. CRIBPO]|uniref:hypothetical protein n=1 Tax=Emticicia sp. CRIBPO TaxID=2683258 RepID=UPI00141282BB|nr:hypothetical protein [Emticicia sp. CRIBPO]NBA88429.1 hypothetical protein [Emticicia sp. CRIBPO]
MTIKNGFLGMLIALGFMWMKGEKKKHWSVPDEPSDVPFVFPYQPAPAFKFPVFIAEPVDKEPEVVHTEKMQMRSYPLQYLGPNKDTITPEFYYFQYNKHLDYQDDVKTKVSYERASPLTMVIQVDTSAFVPYTSAAFEDLVYKTHPVYVFSKGLKPVFIGISYSFLFILEAKDPSGQWKPIEFKFHPCGTGDVGMLIFPGEIGITVVTVYSGPFKTKMRLRMDSEPLNIYSNEFEGSIELSQFKNELGL